jgi:hypothetical protein
MIEVAYLNDVKPFILTLHPLVVELFGKDAEPGQVLVYFFDKRAWSYSRPRADSTEYFWISVFKALAASGFPSAAESSSECLAAISERTCSSTFT